MASRQWRLNISSFYGTGIRLYEVQFRQVAGTPQLFSGGTVSTSSETLGAATKAADNSSSTYWGPYSAVPCWWKYTFATPVEIVEYTIHSQGTLSPTAWTLEYWNDTEWVVADSRSGITSWARNDVGYAETMRFVVGAGLHAQVSQVATEVVRTNTALVARTSQVVAEVLRINTGTVIRASQLAVEVLRPNAVSAVVQNSARPVVFVCT